jgi:hypothetical protein
MPLSQLRALLSSEQQDALAGMQADKLSAERGNALRYYMGDLTKDMPPRPDVRAQCPATWPTPSTA